MLQGCYYLLLITLLFYYFTLIVHYVCPVTCPGWISVSHPLTAVIDPAGPQLAIRCSLNGLMNGWNFCLEVFSIRDEKEHKNTC